ncbi:MAG: DUF4924 family protein [Bacteroidetes bacterium]|nr:DUF4924 family protein [Bacteroidota bacterium]
MLVAKEKRKENIAEYILYLYQVEDLIRAFQSDINLIQEKLVTSYQADEKTSAEITDWYNNLAIMMEKEGIQEKGHLQFLTNLIGDINGLHIQLMNTGTEKVYVQTFNAVSGLITELKQKNSTAKNDIQLGLDTVYGFLLLRMKKAEISEATVNAIKQISQWLGILSNLYKNYEEGKLDL